MGAQTARRIASRGGLAVVLASALLGGAAAAASVPVHCSSDVALIYPRGIVFGLRTTEGPAKVDGYASRCLVAAAVAAAVVNDQAHFFSGRPRSYDVYGARWNAGVWRCTRRFVVHHTTHFEYSDGFVTCLHAHDYGSRANTLTATVTFGYHAGG